MKQQDNKMWTLDTLFVHGSPRHYRQHVTGVPTVPPIYTSTTYLHRNAETLDHAFNGDLPNGEPSYVYARQSNLNATALETVMMQTEHGVGAVTFGSGMAAIHAALLTAGLAPGKKYRCSTRPVRST